MGYDKIDDGAGRWCHCSTHIEWHRTASLRPKAVQSSFGDRSGPPHPTTPPLPKSWSMVYPIRCSSPSLRTPTIFASNRRTIACLLSWNSRNKSSSALPSVTRQQPSCSWTGCWRDWPWESRNSWALDWLAGFHRLVGNQGRQRHESYAVSILIDVSLCMQGISKRVRAKWCYCSCIPCSKQMNMILPSCSSASVSKFSSLRTKIGVWTPSSRCWAIYASRKHDFGTLDAVALDRVFLCRKAFILTGGYVFCGRCLTRVLVREQKWALKSPDSTLFSKCHYRAFPLSRTILTKP